MTHTEATMPAVLIFLAALAATVTLVAMLTIGVIGALALLIASVIVGWLTPSP